MYYVDKTARAFYIDLNPDWQTLQSRDSGGLSALAPRLRKPGGAPGATSAPYRSPETFCAWPHCSPKIIRPENLVRASQPCFRLLWRIDVKNRSRGPMQIGGLDHGNGHTTFDNERIGAGPSIATASATGKLTGSAVTAGQQLQGRRDRAKAGIASCSDFSGGGQISSQCSASARSRLRTVH